MIPKTIHYCWFGGGEKPEMAKNCIESWKKNCPGYKIVEWNEENFDINSNQYVKEAYEKRKWAFVTDYVRLYVLYNYGGIYLDTDVEVLKSLDPFLKHHAFSGFENNDMVPTGIIASERGNIWVKDLLDEYSNLHFIKPNGDLDLITNVVRITNLTEKKYGLRRKSSFQDLKESSVTFYPFDYFCPKSWSTGRINITKNTCTIHHFSGSWMTKKEKSILGLSQKYNKIFPVKMAQIAARVTYYILHPQCVFAKISKSSHFRDK